MENKGLIPEHLKKPTPRWYRTPVKTKDGFKLKYAQDTTWKEMVDLAKQQGPQTQRLLKTLFELEAEGYPEHHLKNRLADHSLTFYPNP